MAQVIPFRGTLYDPSTVGEIRQVVAPPYDIIDAAMQRSLHERHPQNIVRLELGYDRDGDGPASNKYRRAAASLKEWLRTGVMRRDTDAALYYHTIEYVPPYASSGTAPRVLKGFLATVSLEEFGTGHIYPHENTRAAAKSDRLNLMEACAANFSPIFSLYSDPVGEILASLERATATEKPRIDFQDDAGFRQRLWSVTNTMVLQKVIEAMKNKPLFIADGHHRYETALNYRRLRREHAGAGAPGALQPYDAVMMLFSSLEDPGLTVLPTHRVLTTPLPVAADIKQALADSFELIDFPFQPDQEAKVRQEFLKALRTRGQAAHVFGLAIRRDSHYYLLQLRQAHQPAAADSPRNRLDVSILQERVVGTLCPTAKEQEAILYTKDDHEVLNWVLDGTGTAALLLNPTKVSEVQAVASAGERMPHKSTYFFPKPLTGLVINVMEERGS
ncbi:MAG TPA: DUF1015 domain-containing protein [Nitrospiraceae bacterium]|nr:DUF1015 domain-containing protein [Nitrospiraceae bacterium]